jgi:hypothetical protein
MLLNFCIIQLHALFHSPLFSLVFFGFSSSIGDGSYAPNESGQHTNPTFLYILHALVGCAPSGAEICRRQGRTGFPTVAMYTCSVSTGRSPQSVTKSMNCAMAFECCLLDMLPYLELAVKNYFKNLDAFTWGYPCLVQNFVGR